MYEGGLKRNSELRASAREQLKGKWIITVLVILISWILTQAFASRGAMRFELIDGELVRRQLDLFNGFASLIGLIIAGPINLGVALYFLKLARSENAIIEDIFSGFKKFGNALVLNILILIFTTLWMLLFIIPGFIAIFRYSMAYYIMNDNPDISAMDALRQSKEMMKGNKGKLFMLALSFIGWFLLGVLTLGIGFLWVGAYYNTAKANFYEDLKRGYNVNNYTETV